MAKKCWDKKLWIGIGISLFFIFLLFRKIDFNKLQAAFRAMDYRYLWPAVLVTFISYFFRAVRWRFLLLPIKKTLLRNLFPSTIIGYMANNLLPARLGEFVRAYVLGEKEGIDKSSVFATLVLDRLFDGFTVLLILLATFFTVRLPAGMEKVQHGLVVGGYVTLAIYAGVVAFLMALKSRPARTLHLIGKLLKPFPARVSEKAIPMLGSFIEGLRLSSKPSELIALVLLSLLIWATAVWPVDMLLRAFGIVLPITASMFIMVFLVFAVMVPASPGYVGTYHAACVYGLMAFNIQKEKALSVALVIHGISFFPVIFLGLYYLWQGNISLRAVGEKSSRQGG
ncbi:MAG: hypothetical protein FD174_225 [Geobacteraceae bacterium]|nr:MAG: hypothetical protein FD174_225 [Geobacteraceae bacterium]